MKSKYLEFGKLTEPSKEIILQAELLKEDSCKKTLLNIINYLKKLSYIDLERKNKLLWKKLFRKRGVKEIFKTKISYGCEDYTTLFVTLMRICNIPAKYITGKRLGKSGAHTWAQVKINNKWININPISNEINFDYKKSKQGPYKIISKSFDSSDSKIKNYRDWIKLEKEWRKKLT